MRLRLYLDTSVLGALTDPGPEERLVATRRFLDGLAKGFREGFPLLDLVSPWEVNDEEAKE